jgi:hypothetical protein
VIFGFRFPFLYGLFVLVSPLHLPHPPLDNSDTHIQEKVNLKKRVFLDAFTYAPLFTYKLHQPIVLYNSYFIIVFFAFASFSFGLLFIRDSVGG